MLFWINKNLSENNIFVVVCGAAAPTTKIILDE
jgi:hypothetical protein